MNKTVSKRVQQVCRRAARHALTRQGGMTLIEVLISAALISMVLIWISDTHIKSLNDISNSNQRTQAMWLAEELLERVKLAPCNIPSIQAELAQANSDSYCQIPQDCVGNSCSAVEMSRYNVQQVFCNDTAIRNLAMELTCYDTLTDAPVALCAGNNRAEMTARWDAGGQFGGGLAQQETTLAMLLRTTPRASEFSRRGTRPIPECCGQPVTDTVDVVAPAQGDWCNLVVEIDLYHTYLGDLTIAMVGPDGRNYPISNRQGGATRDVPDQVINRAANLSNGAINGTWTLRIEDRANQDTGNLKGWAIRFE